MLHLRGQSVVFIARYTICEASLVFVDANSAEDSYGSFISSDGFDIGICLDSY